MGSIYKPQVEPWRSILRGKSLFTNSICCLEERFVWEISIYKLNWSVSCGKFLFTNSTSVFSHLQTIYKPIYKILKGLFSGGHIKIQSLIGGTMEVGSAMWSIQDVLGHAGFWASTVRMFSCGSV